MLLAVPQIIRVPEAFVFQEGARVTEDLVTGKLLGDGVQGQVYVLKRPNGDSTDQLLKVSCAARFVAFGPCAGPRQCGSYLVAPGKSRSCFC